VPFICGAAACHSSVRCVARSLLQIFLEAFVRLFPSPGYTHLLQHLHNRFSA
jgi:hypothetical protein